MEKVQELKRDIHELETLMQSATRLKVKDILSIECRKLVTESVKIEEQLKADQLSATNAIAQAKIQNASVPSRRYQVKINNYAWDQTNKFVKFYVTLKNVQKLQPENVTCTFTPKSMELLVTDLDDKDYIFTVNKLLETIQPEGSNWKIKNDMVIINLAKEAQVNWSHITEIEKKATEAKKMPAVDKNADPNDGLMSIMKSMYDQGDDEMKRTIAKAWTESQNKNMNLS